MDAAQELEPVEEVLTRALRQVTDGHIRAAIVRRLLSLYLLDSAQTEEVVRRLGGAGIALDGQLDYELDEDEQPELVEFSRADKPTDRQLEQCIASARALLVDRRTGRAHRHRVLTAEEEVGLAALVRSDSAPLHASLPAGYRRALASNSEAARAFDALVEHNVRLVWSIARSYGGNVMDLDDVASSGMFGLLRAVEMFDASLGYKFSTYATWWIRQSISRAMANEAAMIRLPVHVVEQVNRMRGVWERLEQDDPGNVRLAAVAKALDVPPSKVVWLLNVSRGTYSLDKPLGTDAKLTLRDVIPADADLEDSYGRQEVTKAVNEVLSGLTERERRVVRLRYGFETGEVMTLEEVGREFGLTRERIRQIQEKTLTKLRHPRRSQPLLPHYVIG